MLDSFGGSLAFLDWSSKNISFSSLGMQFGGSSWYDNCVRSYDKLYDIKKDEFVSVLLVIDFTNNSLLFSLSYFWIMVWKKIFSIDVDIFLIEFVLFQLKCSSGFYA